MTISQSGQQILARSGSDSSHDIVYLLQSNQSDIEDQVADVVSWMQNNLSATYLGQDLASANYAEIGNGWWSVTVSYSTQDSQNKNKSEPPEINDDPDWKFSIATESKTLRDSKSLYSVTPSHNGWTNYLGKPYPIGFDGKDVQGVDIPVPVPSWEETYYFDPDDIDQTYRLNCLSLVGKVNNATFRGASARQVLLQSVEGNKKGATPWAITFSFLYKPNYTATYRMSNGNELSVTLIGHQYADFRYGRIDIAGITFQAPKAILVHDVFEQGDFTLLGIGS